MIIYNKEKVNKINEWTDDSFYIIADFDRTLTTHDSKTSWSVLYNHDKVDRSFKDTANKLFEYYRPIEIDENIDKKLKNNYMQEWWLKIIDLSIKYEVTNSIIKELINNQNIIKFRPGAKKLLKNMHQRNIPIIIISAGLGNLIEEFLKVNNCYYDNIYIISNFLEFNNNLVTGIKGKIIHSLNKNETSLSSTIKTKLNNRHNTILFGDQIADIGMLSPTNQNTAIKIGFLEEKVKENKKHYLNNFDIVCTNKTSYNNLIKEFPILYKDIK